MKRTLAYAMVERVFLEVHPEVAPSDADWNELIQSLLDDPALDQTVGGIIIAEGPGPNAGQRAKVAAIPGMGSFRIAVLTSSLVARGAIMALKWLGYGYRAFDPKNLDGGLSYIGAPASTHMAIVRRLAELKCELLEIPISNVLASGATLRDIAVMSTRELKRRALEQSALTSVGN